MKRDAKVLILDIKDSIEKIEQYSGSFSKEEFSRNTMVQDSVLRRLEIIGEAVKNIPEEFKAKYNKVEWKKISGMRDIIIHSYFGVNVDMVWATLKKELPEFKSNILKILEDFEK